MICSKIPHRVLIYSFAFFAFSLFTLFSCSSSVSATSVNCGRIVDNVPLSQGTTFDFSSCDTSSLDSNVQWFYNVDFSYTQDTFHGGSSPYFALCQFSYTSSCTSVFNLYAGTLSYSGSISVLSTWGNTVPIRYSYLRLLYSNSNAQYFTLTVDLVITDTYSGCPDSPSGTLNINTNGTYDVTNYAEAVVDVPPEVIQGDYHDDLENIKQAILICGGVLLVLYFFYAIYRVLIRSTGGWR